MSRQSVCEEAIASAASRLKQQRLLIAVSVVGLLLAVVLLSVVSIRSSRAEAARIAEVARFWEEARVAEVERLARVEEEEEEARVAEVERLARVEAARIASLPPYANTLGMSFKLLPSGPEGGFSIGVHEVTQSQYEAVMGNNPSSIKGKNNPVENVFWGDAVAFCAKLSALPAEVAAGHVYRLPTEAEWEYACRAGTTTAYSFGEDAKDLGKYAWFGDNSREITHPVGEKLPNGWGLYDMHGNVWEWCSDWYGSKSEARVLRGGSWGIISWFARSAYRSWDSPDDRYGNYGFRVVCSSLP